MSATQKTPLLEIPVSRPFHLGYMVLSHGWVELAPYRWDRGGECLHAVIRTRGERAFALKIASRKNGRPEQVLIVMKEAGPRPGKRDLALIKDRLRWCFRLDEDFTPFQKLCARTEGLEWVRDFGLGPFLRNPDLFEEFVKVLITTNINWAGTKLLNRLLLEHLGRPIGRSVKGKTPVRTFPTPERVALAGERFLREKIRLGYRAPYLIAMARRFQRGEVEADRFLDPSSPTKELAGSLKTFKGFGPYSVNSILFTLGRFDHLILDSWIRKMVSRIHFKGKRVADTRIMKQYARFGEWAGLACWFECAYATWFKDELHGRGRGVVVNSSAREAGTKLNTRAGKRLEQPRK